MQIGAETWSGQTWHSLTLTATLNLTNNIQTQTIYIQDTWIKASYLFLRNIFFPKRKLLGKRIVVFGFCEKGFCQ